MSDLFRKRRGLVGSITNVPLRQRHSSYSDYDRPCTEKKPDEDFSCKATTNYDLMNARPEILVTSSRMCFLTISLG
jgi:hypothetical protein